MDIHEFGENLYANRHSLITGSSIQLANQDESHWLLHYSVKDIVTNSDHEKVSCYSIEIYDLSLVPFFDWQLRDDVTLLDSTGSFS